MDDWMILLGVDGRVAAVSGAPEGWLGSSFESLPSLPEAARSEARRLIERVRDPRLRLSMDQARLAPAGSLPALTLAVAECVPIRRAPTALLPLLERCLAPLVAQAEALDISLTLEPQGPLPEGIFFDPEKIGWAVAQLAGNALRYVRRGTRTIPGGTVRVAVEGDEARGQVVIVVEDDGAGVPPEKLPWLFARQPGSASAVGLSLLLVREIIEAQGGELHLASSTGPDHGTRVTLRLPYR